MHRSTRAFKIIGFGLAPIAALALLRSAFAAPVILYNPSPSEPKGFYRLTQERPSPGHLAAFRVPMAGRAYAAVHIPYLLSGSILKEIVAGEGDQVCSRNNRIDVDGRDEGNIAAADHNGAALPHWEGCLTLSAGEFFVLSHRIPNSFDSRYYGPVREADIVGIYVPLWTE